MGLAGRVQDAPFASVVGVRIVSITWRDDDDDDLTVSTLRSRSRMEPSPIVVAHIEIQCSRDELRRIGEIAMSQFSGDDSDEPPPGD